MQDVKEAIRQVLYRFQQGYLDRDLNKLDEFMELFLSSDEIELIGIGASARKEFEWFQGVDQVREIIESDWKYWGDVRIDADQAKITVRDKVAWLSMTGAILQTDHIQTDELTNFTLNHIKEILENESLDPGSRLMETTHYGMRRLRERQKKAGYRWPFVITAVLVEHEKQWLFHTIHWSMPVD